MRTQRLGERAAQLEDAVGTRDPAAADARVGAAQDSTHADPHATSGHGNTTPALDRVARGEAGPVLERLARRLEDDPDTVLARLLALVHDHPAGTRATARRADLAPGTLADQIRQFTDHALTTTQVRSVLGGISRQAVAQRVVAGRLLAGQVGGLNYFPAWQFTAGGTVPGLGRVLTALAACTDNPVTADALMRARLVEHDGSCLADLFAAGRVDEVVTDLTARTRS